MPEKIKKTHHSQMQKKKLQKKKTIKNQKANLLKKVLRLMIPVKLLNKSSFLSLFIFRFKRFKKPPLSFLKHCPILLLMVSFMQVQTIETDLLNACTTIFGSEVNASIDFLNYLEPVPILLISSFNGQTGNHLAMSIRPSASKLSSLFAF